LNSLYSNGGPYAKGEGFEKIGFSNRLSEKTRFFFAQNYCDWLASRAAYVWPEGAREVLAIQSRRDAPGEVAKLLDLHRAP
jgi:hypothetical protein